MCESFMFCVNAELLDGTTTVLQALKVDQATHEPAEQPRQPGNNSHGAMQPGGAGAPLW